MEILLLLVVVIGWLVVRGMDRREFRQRLAEQEQELVRLRSEVAALVRMASTVPVAEPQPVARKTMADLVLESVEPDSVARADAPSLPLTDALAGALEARAARVVPVVAFQAPKPPPPPPPRGEESFPVENEPRRSLEQTLGVNWLNRLGIVLLVFGVAFYLAFQLTHLGPVGKVLMGFAVSGTLLGGGLWLERKERYRVFARAGIGGGWALAFLTTYAMYFFPATQVLASQTIDLVLLFCVGVGMVAHSLRYRSQVVTGLAFLLAFSTVTISQVTAFSMLASAVLALGLEFVCVREVWYELEIAGVIAAYGNHFLWLDRTLGQYGGAGHPFPLWGESTALLLLFWAIFRAGYCLRRPPTEAGEGMSGLVAVLNSAGVLALMKYQSFHPEYAFRALLGLGSVELILAFVMCARRRPAFAVLMTIASVLLVAAIPLRFGGATWPLLWVLEGEALFVGGMVLRERLMRWLGMIVHLLVVVQMLYMHGGVMLVEHGPGWGQVAATFFVVAAAMWVNSEWLGRKDDEAADEAGGVSPYRIVLSVSSCAAALCAAVGLWVMVPGWTLALLWAALALVLVEAGLRVRTLALRLEGYAVLAMSLVRLVGFNFSAPGVRGFGDLRLWAGVGVIAACVLLYERLGRAPDTTTEQERSIAGGAVMWCASALVSTLLYMELPEKWLAAGWAGFALILAGSALLRDGARLRSKALLLALIAAGRAMVVNLGPVFFWGSTMTWSPDWGRLAFFSAVALLAAGVPVGLLLRRQMLPEGKGPFRMDALLRRPEQVFFFSAVALLVAWVPADLHKGMLTMGWSGLGVAVFLVALAAGERSFRLAGLGLLMLGVAKLLVVDVWGLPPTERYLLLIGVGVALLLVSFLYSRFGERLKEFL